MKDDFQKVVFFFSSSPNYTMQTITNNEVPYIDTESHQNSYESYSCQIFLIVPLVKSIQSIIYVCKRTYDCVHHRESSFGFLVRKNEYSSVENLLLNHEKKRRNRKIF